MKYNIFAIADIHWGAMDPSEMYSNLSIVLEFIRQKKDIDLVVICGDYFDYRLTLNSKAALLALKWFDELYKVCQESGVQKLRMIKGTQDHDNDQLDAIHPKEEGEFFKKFYVNTIEETLPGLKCIYCPDETMNVADYENAYIDNLVQIVDIGFFHGNFDEMLPSMVIDQNLSAKLPSIIYFKHKWQTHIRGPLIAGHWHIFTDLDPVYYIGSFDRWKYCEEEEKGALFIQYDTEDHSYCCERIINPFARNYVSLVVNSELVSTPEDFAKLRTQIEELKHTDPRIKIRVVYTNTTENSEGMHNFNEFRNVVSGMRGVKVDLKDLVKKKKKKKEREETIKASEQYAYILENPKDIINNIHEFLLREKNVDIPIERIKEILKKYMEKFE